MSLQECVFCFVLLLCCVLVPVGTNLSGAAQAHPLESWSWVPAGVKARTALTEHSAIWTAFVLGVGSSFK